MSIPRNPLSSWLDNVALAALSSRETVQSSYDTACLALINKIPGDFVECGVFGGAQCAAMARALMNFGLKDRRVHLFDGFEGIPQAGPEDREFLEAEHPPGLSACSVETVRAHMAEWGVPEGLLVWHPGPFAETMQYSARFTGALEAAGIAVLRLDGDLYESTKVCMEHLYPLVSRGGYVICDDFDLSGARKAVLDYVKDGFGPVQWRKK